MKKRLLSLALCGALLCGALAGCGGNETPSTSQESSPSQTAEEPKILTTAVSAELNTLYPLNMDVQNNIGTKLCYEGLVNYENGEIVPCLAESWEFSDDGKALTFHLKEGVTFHDGTPFNAEAVKTDFEFAHPNPNFSNISAAAKLESIEVVDEYTVTFRYPNAYFAYLMDFCYPETMVLVSPAVLEEGNYQSMNGVVGTGPYVYEEIVDGDYVRFVRNENYWGEQPYYDEVIVKYIPDASARLQALQSGEIDLIYGSALLTWDDYQQATSLPNIAGAVAESDSKTRNLVLNASGVLSDLRVREAVAYAIDKEELSQATSNGYEPAADMIVTRDTPYADVELETTYDYNPDKANQLLDEAGWVMNESTGIREKDGEPLNLLLTLESDYSATSMPTAEVIKSQLAEVGIDVTIYGTEQMQWYADYLEGKFDLTLWHSQFAFASPHCWFTPMDSMVPQTPSLPGIEGSDEFLATIKNLTNMVDEQEVRDTYTYLFNFDIGTALDIPLTYQKDMIVYNTDKISGYTFTGTPYFFDILSLEPAE